MDHSPKHETYLLAFKASETPIGVAGTLREVITTDAAREAKL